MPKMPYPPTDWDDTSWTWDKFVEIGQEADQEHRRSQHGVYGASRRPVAATLDGLPMIFGTGLWPRRRYTTGFADKVTVTDPTVDQAFQAFHDLVYKDKVAPDPATTPGAGSARRCVPVRPHGDGHERRLGPLGATRR